MKTNKIKLMCMTGIFTAIVFVFTTYVKIPSHTGYTHIGDAFIYLSACILPFPFALFPGAIGAMLADVLGGYAMWVPASIIIKALSSLLFSHRAKMFSARNLPVLIPSSLLCIVGYYLYEVIITANFVAPLAGIPGYVTQSVLSSAVFIVLGIIFDKTNFIKRALDFEPK